MKVKIKKEKGELIVDYYNAKNVQDFRYTSLEYIVQMAKNSLLLFVDTNSSIKKIPIDEIKNLLDKFDIEYSLEPVFKTERKIFGFANFLKKKKKPQKVENIIAIKMDKNKFSKEIYDEFFKYYDYAIGLDCEIGTLQMLKLYSDEYEEILFNKEVLKETFYDSILFCRLRTDCTQRGLEDHLRKNSV